MRWSFRLPGKKRPANQEEAGPSTRAPARRSSVSPSSSRPPRPSSVAADAIANIPLVQNPNPSSSVASAHNSGRMSGATNPTTSADASSVPAGLYQSSEPAEPHVAEMEEEAAPAEQPGEPVAALDHSGSFHWSYSFPELTPITSLGTQAARIEGDGDIIQQFLGNEFLASYGEQLSDGGTRPLGATDMIQGEAGAGFSDPAALQTTAPAHYYSEGYYPAGPAMYQSGTNVFNNDGVCTTCACYGGHYAWCAYRHVPLPLPVDYRCALCNEGGHLDTACPRMTQLTQSMNQSYQPTPQQPEQPVPLQIEPPAPTVPRSTSSRHTPQSSQDSGQQLRGSHCPLCGTHKKHWYRNLVDK